MKIKQLFSNWRILFLLIFVVLMVLAISPSPWRDGVAIRSVDRDSAAYDSGILGGKASTSPLARERVISLNNFPIHNEVDYHNFVSTLVYNQTVSVRTSKGVYALITEALYENVTLNETEMVPVFEEVFNTTTNTTKNVTTGFVERQKVILVPIGVKDIGLSIYDAPISNIRKGLDLAGGTRILLKPVDPVTANELELLADHIKQRLNAFGLSDIVVRTAKDLSSASYIVVEIAGSDDEQLRELLQKQGKFEARIGEEVVFGGGKDDITFICRSPECSRLTGCSIQSAGQYSCGFEFSITLSSDAAHKQADVTKQLDILTNGSQPYLSEPLDLILDGEVTNSLQIAADLRGRAVNQILISGGASGATQQQAAQAALEDMKSMQTVLSTGSLPTELEIEKVDAVSPTLGSEFTKNALLAGFLGMCGVILVVSIRYRRISIVAPMALTMISEVVIILGIAALIGWNLDLAAIAGIIIAVGTGVDDQIVIIDETLSSASSDAKKESWKNRLKKAFFIIVAAYFTTVVAMVPLFFAGAGLLKAFAITTILGVTAGVLITRPAYAAMIEIFVSQKEE